MAERFHIYTIFITTNPHNVFLKIANKKPYTFCIITLCQFLHTRVMLADDGKLLTVIQYHYR